MVVIFHWDLGKSTDILEIFFQCSKKNIGNLYMESSNTTPNPNQLSNPRGQPVGIFLS